MENHEQPRRTADSDASSPSGPVSTEPSAQASSVPPASPAVASPSGALDFRSDTVTRPSAGMRAAMLDAAVGDDVYGEDPTVRALEEYVAKLLGKDEAIFVPSGTMSNQIAVQLHCRPGDEILLGVGSHLFFYEIGGAAAFAGAQCVEVGDGGLFDGDDVRGGAKQDLYYLARPSLVVVENTHNRAGGRLFSVDRVDDIAAAARQRGLRMHLDGARIWNAAVALNVDLARLAAPFDTVSVCFSKGLGAPVGSALVGDREAMQDARRVRRRMGGAMRQAGIIAAGALYALEHNRARVADDHVTAKRLASGIQAIPNLSCSLAEVESNLVCFDTDGPAEDWVEKCAAKGVLLSAIGPRRIRAVTHMDLASDAVDRCLEALR